MPVFYDQLQRPVNIPSSPQRIISVVPSQTELLFYLGLDERIVGITKFCIHPAQKCKNVTKVGGTKQLDIPLIKSLQPDLIIANKEENQQQQIEEIARHFPVWISDVDTLPAAMDMIHNIGRITEQETTAGTLCRQIQQGFNSLTKYTGTAKAVYLIWRKPYMAAGKNTFIDAMLRECGIQNALHPERYPEVTAGQLIALDPALVFLSSEPYPFGDKHINEIKDILPRAKVVLVDGEMFSWYGSRLLAAPAYFNHLISRL